MTKAQQDQLAKAYNDWIAAKQTLIDKQNAVNAINQVLNNDPIKSGETILYYDGNNYTRSDLQIKGNNFANEASNLTDTIQFLEKAYNTLNSSLQAQDAAALAQSQANFNTQNPGVVAGIKNKIIEATTTAATTKYLIYGAIGIVIIIGALIIIRAKTKIA